MAGVAAVPVPAGEFLELIGAGPDGGPGDELDVLRYAPASTADVVAAVVEAGLLSRCRWLRPAVPAGPGF
jgi:hypothetical protein